MRCCVCQDNYDGESSWRSPPRYDQEEEEEEEEPPPPPRPRRRLPRPRPDNSDDLLPTVYRDDPDRPDSLGYRMPSHAELEKNYRTEVTAGSDRKPVYALPYNVVDPTNFEPKKLKPKEGGV